LLAAGWLRQLGMGPERIVLAEAQQSQKRKRVQYDIHCILEERASTGRALSWFLVRWEGYHHSWEIWRIQGRVGSPLETWEPFQNVKGTEALSAWDSLAAPTPA
jgi:hypothetical protein